MRDVFFTGATGCLGMLCVRELSKRGWIGYTKLYRKEKVTVWRRDYYEFKLTATNTSDASRIRLDGRRNLVF